MKDKELIVLAEKLKQECYSCKKCELCSADPDPHVFAIGNVCAKIMILAEAPGKTEVELKRPLVGKSGKLFDKAILGGLGLSRKDVWITNTVLCRPPNNRKPDNKEIEACNYHLLNQIELIKPKIIITLGMVPLNILTGISSGITKLASKPIFSKKYKMDVFPMLHPSYIMRTGNYKLLDKHTQLLKEYLIEKGICDETK